LALGAAAILAMSGAPARADEASGVRSVTVDWVPIGTLRPLSGVNAGADGAEFYRTARIDLVSMNDRAGDSDESTIFPDLSADVENPQSYNFAATDRVIAAIEAAGAQPLFRIGRNIVAADPAADVDKFAQIARHIVLHYNQGWDKGFRYAIRYWEIWNEPDSKAFWTASAAQYYDLYDKTARAITSADPNALIGGPSISKPLDSGAYREGFLDYVRWHRLPLDFFSWHCYPLNSNDPYDIAESARSLRKIIDARGFGSAKSILDQWNMDLTTPEASQADQAAFAASALIYMLSGPIDAQTFDRGDAVLSGENGAPDAVGQALTAFGSMKKTPNLLRTSGGDDVGFAVLAGRSGDGRVMQILISNYQLPAQRTLAYHDNGGYDATINLPSSVRYRVMRYRISEAANFELVDQTVQKGPVLHLQAALAPPGIEFIVITTL
jgi:xylan 1,4-beta-xylosidase